MRVEIDGERYVSVEDICQNGIYSGDVPLPDMELMGIQIVYLCAVSGKNYTFKRYAVDAQQNRQREDRGMEPWPHGFWWDDASGFRRMAGRRNHPDDRWCFVKIN